MRGVGAQREKACLDGFCVQRGCRCFGDLLGQCRWQLGRGKQANPEVIRGVGEARFHRGRHIGQRRGALR